MNQTTQAVMGHLHFIFSISALIYGSAVMLLPKGSKLHKILGYGYFISMILMLTTAFMTYRLYGSFGVFHWLAVISALTLIAGMLPVLIKKPVLTYRLLHLQFMYWSVIGLYMGLVAEVFTRIPGLSFMAMVIVSSAVVYVLGIIGMLINYKKWQNRFDMRHKIVTNRLIKNEK